MTIPFIDPDTSDPVYIKGNLLLNKKTDQIVAHIKDDIPRFIDAVEDELNSFSWQWNTYSHTKNDQDGVRPGLRKEILSRTNFPKLDLQGKTILECGMGGGDDTEVLITFPFSEIHSFDLSNSVETTANNINDSRLTISQASIFKIPYLDEAFDVVYCHRVLQHTPDPELALKTICSKVKHGGILFAHSYKCSWRYMIGWKYKYRWFTKHLPLSWVYWYVENCGASLHRINKFLYKNAVTKYLAYSFVPFYVCGQELIYPMKACSTIFNVPVYP